MSLGNEAKRTDRLVEALDGAGVDLIVVTNLINVRYLTGYTGSNGLAIIGSDTRVFVTDFRYVEQSAVEVDASYERVIGRQDLLGDLVGQLPDGQLRVGFEADHVSVSSHARLRELLPERAELVGVQGLVEGLRLVKDEQEIAHIAAAAKIADDAFEALIASGLKGRTERELAITLEHDMRVRGAESPSFRPIIAAGPHGALPHAEPRDVTVKDGDLVVIDWGALYQGYCSDCTRTVAVGEIGPEAREAYELVLSAQLEGLDAVKAGANAQEIDKLVRDIIYSAGHSEHYGHGLGHGVGLEIHEAPTLTFRFADSLQAGNVVTVEPGVYLPGKFGIRIEDLVVVEQDSIRILTSLPKALRVVD
jgi:Xaa-Pro aminopeptidase